MNGKIIIIILIVVSIIVVATVAVIHSQSKHEVVTEEPVSFTDDAAKYSIISREYNVSSNNFVVNSKIPQFVDLDPTFNSYINNKMTQELDYNMVYKDMIQGMGSSDIGLFTYETNFERYNFGYVVSLIVNQRASLEGQRETVRRKCYVIDTKNNSSAKLMDVFKNKSGYKKAVLNEINDQAFQKNIQFIGGNQLQTLSDLQSFYIKDRELYIYFEPSEIASFSDGQLDFKMPFKEEDGLFVFTKGE